MLLLIRLVTWHVAGKLLTIYILQLQHASGIEMSLVLLMVCHRVRKNVSGNHVSCQRRTAALYFKMGRWLRLVRALRVLIERVYRLPFILIGR